MHVFTCIDVVGVDLEPNCKNKSKYQPFDSILILIFQTKTKSCNPKTNRLLWDFYGLISSFYGFLSGSCLLITNTMGTTPLIWEPLGLAIPSLLISGLWLGKMQGGFAIHALPDLLTIRGTHVVGEAGSVFMKIKSNRTR